MSDTERQRTALQKISALAACARFYDDHELRGLLGIIRLDALAALFPPAAGASGAPAAATQAAEVHHNAK